MVDVFILSLLVGANILINLYFKYEESSRGIPLTSREWHFFRYDDLEKLKEIINESDSKRRIEQFEEFRRLRKDIKNGSGNSSPKTDDNA